MSTKEELTHMCKVTDRVNDFESMVDYARALLALGQPLTDKELHYVWTAFKERTGELRRGWQTITDIENAQDDAHKKALAKQIRMKLETEVKGLCKEIMTVVESHLAKASSPKDKAHFLKLKADYHRYQAQVTIGADAERATLIETGRTTYQASYDIAKKELQPNDSIRLGLVLNFAALYATLIKDKPKACEIMKEAMAEVDAMNLSKEERRKLDDSIHLMRQNLKLWSDSEHGSSESDEESTNNE